MSRKQDAGKSRMYGKAQTQMFLVTVLGVALSPRGSACSQDVSMVGLVCAITCGFKGFFF